MRGTSNWKILVSVVFLLVIAVLSSLAVFGSPVHGHEQPGTQSVIDSPSDQVQISFNQINASPPGERDDWPMKGGNAANTAHINSTGPTGPFTTRWKFSTKAERLKTVVKDGTIYVSAYNHDDNGEDQVLAVDAWTGKIKWRFTLNGTQPRTVAVLRDTVYVTQWEGKMYALNSKSGEVFWTFKTEGNMKSPIVSDRTVYLATNDKLYALAALTGKVRWQFTPKGRVVTFKPAVHGGTVYFAKGKHNSRYAYGLDAESGTVKWRVHMENKGGFMKRASVANGIVYFSSNQGDIYAMDTETGDLQWHKKIRGTSVRGAPTLAGDTAYIGTHDGPMFALNAKTGETRWTFRKANGRPRVVNGTAYLGGLRTVYAIDAETGGELARYTIDEPWRTSGTVVVNNSIYLTSTQVAREYRGEEGPIHDTRLYAVGTPNINYEKIVVSSRSVDINETLTASISINNTGTGPGSFNATVSVNSNLVDFTTGKIAPRNQTKITFNLQFPKKGIYTIEIGGRNETIAVGDVATPSPTQTSTERVETKTILGGETATHTAETTTPTNSATSSSSPGFGVVVWLLAVAVVLGWFGRRQRN